jgi:alpha-galactosidase
MSRALNATGAPIYFDSCEWGVDNPWEWASPYMNAWRIAGDHHDTFSGSTPPATEGVIEAIAGKSTYAGPGGYNDADMVYTGGQGCPGQTELGAHCPGQSDIEYQTEFSIWTIAAIPIFVATNVANMTDIMNKTLLNKDLIAIHQDPMGVAGDRRGFTNDPGCPVGYCQLWSKPLANGDLAALMYNRDTSPHNITMPFGVLNATWADAKASLYDVWAHQTVGTFTDSYTALVEGHGVVMVRMTKQ